eukprot:508474-Rhodomonas_salina.1
MLERGREGERKRDGRAVEGGSTFTRLIDALFKPTCVASHSLHSISPGGSKLYLSSGHGTANA